MNFILKYQRDERFSLDFQKLAEYMWFDYFKGDKLDISYFGNDDLLNINHVLSLRWNKEINDPRWGDHDARWTYEDIDLLRFKGVKTNLFVTTAHKDILTVDQRALYRLVYKLTAPFDAKISADNGKTWQTPSEFKLANQLVINLKFALANDLSLLETETFSLEEEEDRNDIAY